MMKYLVLVLLLCSSITLKAQQNPVSKVKVTQQLPGELLKSRSVAIIHVAEGGVAKNESWEAVAKALHPGFIQAGVDVVAYYELGNVLSGPDAIVGFQKDFQQREIQNVILVEKNGSYTITVAPLGKNSLIDAGAPAWQTTTAKAQDATAALYTAASAAKLHLSNFLIPEVPELFYTTDNIAIKKRFFSYPLDLKFDKLAVPAYSFMKSSGDSLSAINAVMQPYPYEWGATKPGTTEEVLRMKQGFPYVLLYLHTTQDNLRRFLSYAPDKEAPLELQSGPDTGIPLYKFYIRHIPTGDVYAGSSWDAAADWQTALRNFWQGLRKDQAANIK